MYPEPMDLYDRAVANGASRAAAMRAAAYEMANTGPARPHGWRRRPAVGPGPEPVVGTDGFDTAVGQEQTRLAEGAPEAAYAEQLEHLGVGGSAAAQALREVLAARAAQHPRLGQTNAPTPQARTFAGVHENASSTMPGNPVAAGDCDNPGAVGDRDNSGVRTAARLAAQWYPDGMYQPGGMPAHVANRRPANAHAQRPHGERGAVRTR